MIYEFLCKKCNCIDEVIRHHLDTEDVICDDCGSKMDRQYSAPNVITQGESVPYFNHALGQVVKSDSEAKSIARQKGWVEIGNEDVSKHIKPAHATYDI